MLLLKYLLMFTGIGMLLGAAGILAWDLYRILKPREPGESKPVRWDHVKRLAAYALAPLFAALSIAVVPSGSAAVRVNQFLGTRPKTLYPGVHLVFPLIESLKTAWELGDKVLAMSSLEYLAWLAHSQGQSERAAQLYGAADSLRATFGYHLSPSEQNKHVTRTIAVRAALGDDVIFEAAWQAGRVMTLEQAIILALEEPGRIR